MSVFRPSRDFVTAFEALHRPSDLGAGLYIAAIARDRHLRFTLSQRASKGAALLESYGIVALLAGIVYIAASATIMEELPLGYLAMACCQAEPTSQPQFFARSGRYLGASG